MSCTRRDFLTAAASAAALVSLSACGSQQSQQTQTNNQDQTPKVDTSEFKELAIDMNAWEHDDEHDVWYQLNLPYCKNPATKTYESMAIYVPGSYFEGSKGINGKYSCKIKEAARQGNFTATTAPVVMPINAGDFSAQMSPTSYMYEGLSPYLQAGFIYVFAGFRGRANGADTMNPGKNTKDGFFAGGAPWGVTDLKAAIRCLRYNNDVLAGDENKVFTFGLGGGGAISAILGSSGDAKIYEPYLKELGAPTHDAFGNALSDTTTGSMCWSPEFSFSAQDLAYEWYAGQFATQDTRSEGVWTKELSNDMARSYASYVNNLKLQDKDNNQLTLDETVGGIFVSGSYYAYLLNLVEESVNVFLTKTKFPYTPAVGNILSGEFAGSGQKQGESSTLQEGLTPLAQTVATQAQSFATPRDYITALNSNGRWITYNERQNKAHIVSLDAFIAHCCPAMRQAPSYDSVERKNPANQLFGTSQHDALHFDATIADLLEKNQERYNKLAGWNGALVSDWHNDLQEKDDLGTDITQRRNMYDPIYFLNGTQQGFRTAGVAQHWRINTGIFQTTTPLTATMNLACALQHYEGVQSLEVHNVWGQGMTLAEDEGDAITNFIAWVTNCAK